MNPSETIQSQAPSDFAFIMRNSATQEAAWVNGKNAAQLTAVGTPKQRRADGLENKIRQPHNEVRRPFRPVGERLAQHDETVVNEHQAQSDGDPHIRFPPMHANTERNRNKGKPKQAKENATCR